MLHWLQRVDEPRRDRLDVKDMLIDAVLDWRRQQADFESDGILRDIYIQATTAADWKLVAAHILDGDYRARLECGGAVVAMPREMETAFAENARYSMTFTVGGIGLVCHFFSPTEIELSFEPHQVSEAGLRALLSFVIELGDVTGKPVLVSPENCPQAPIFRYDPSDRHLRWISAPGPRGP